MDIKETERIIGEEIEKMKKHIEEEIFKALGCAEAQLANTAANTEALRETMERSLREINTAHYIQVKGRLKL